MAKLVFVSVIVIFCAYGCGEEEQSPMEVVTRIRSISAIDTEGMVLIPAGEFEMGDHHGDGWERSVHPVYLDSFYIDKYEVTNARYAQFLNEYGKNTDPAGHR